VKYNDIFDRRRIFTLDGSNDADSSKDVPFGGFVDIAHFGGEIPQDPNFGGVNRRFQGMTSKTATNQNGYIKIQNGHMIMVIGEHVSKYLSLNKLGIIKSRTKTMPEVGFKRNALH